MKCWHIGHIQGNEDMTFEEGLDKLKDTFHDYINTEVLSKVEVDNLGKKKTKY